MLRAWLCPVGHTNPKLAIDGEEPQTQATRLKRQNRSCPTIPATKRLPSGNFTPPHTLKYLFYIIKINLNLIYIHQYSNL